MPVGGQVWPYGQWPVSGLGRSGLAGPGQDSRRHPGGGDSRDGIVDWTLSGLDGAGFLIWDEECSGRTMSVIPRLTGKYTDYSIRVRCDPPHIVDKSRGK